MNILVMCLVVESKTLLAPFFLFFFCQCCIISAGKFDYNIHALLRHTHHTNKVQKCHFPQLEQSLRGLAVTVKGSTPKTLVGRSCLMALISAGETEQQASGCSCLRQSQPAKVATCVIHSFKAYSTISKKYPSYRFCMKFAMTKAVFHIWL